ncbi:MAG: hypothetical protein JNL13_05470 [Chitinophagaceae bacterium]|nr:hypothetical protein [Chitinophagaceae bacterium]
MKIKNKLVVFLLLASCNTQLDDREFAAYVKDSGKGLRKTITVDQIVYDVQYMPARMILVQEQLQADEKKKRAAQLKGTLWFTISLKCLHSSVNPLKYQVSGIEEYNERLDYFLNHAGKNIRLDYGTKVLQPISYHFENNYGLTANETIMVGFEMPEEEQDADATLVFEDKVFKNGIIKAFFPADKLRKANKI